MEVRDVIEYIIQRIKERVEANRQQALDKQRNPYEDRNKFFKEIKFDIDYDYLAEVLQEAFKVGVFIMPQDAKELENFYWDIYTNFIEEDVFPSKVSFQRKMTDGYHDKPSLARLVEEYQEKQNFPYPELRMQLNLQDFDKGTNEQFEEIYREKSVYCGCSRYTGGYTRRDPDMSTWKHDQYFNSSVSQYYFKQSRWVKGKINLKLTIPKTMDLSDENIEKICDFIKKAHEKSQFMPGEIDISFDQNKSDPGSSRYRFDQRKLSDVKKLNDRLESMGCSVKYSEFNTSFNGNDVKWNFDQLQKANSCIDELANTIKKNKLSPFEAVLFVSAWCSKNLKYNDNGNDLELNNTIVSAVNNQLIRCVGFSEFTNAVLNAAGFETTYGKGGQGVLFAEKISCTTSKDSGGNITPDHSQSLIHIEDPKYNINGNYICDVNAINFVGELTKAINEIISGMTKTQIDIKAFSSLCLKNLDEYRALNPNYTIFPYAPTDRVNIEYERQISVGSIEKFISIQRELASAKSAEQYDEILKKHNIKFSSIPVKIDGQDYGEFMQSSKDIMRGLKKTQGKSIPIRNYTEAYGKILFLLYPELLKDKESWSVAVSSIEFLNKQITQLVEASFEENQFDIGSN